MNRYCKYIIIENLIEEVVDEIKDWADTLSIDVTARNFKDNLFGNHLREVIKRVVEKYLSEV